MINTLQEALRNGWTIKDLEEKLYVYAKRHKDFPYLVLFKYDQINSPMGNPIVQAARGVILNENNNWSIVAWPFNKFFNEGEGHATPIDWNTAKVQEKLDGSLATLYYHDNKWHVATSGTPDAGGQVNGLNFSFGELFWKVWNQLGYELPTGYETHTFVFELMTPFNRIVVPHRESKIALIGVRNIVTGQELPVNYFYGNDWAVVKEFPLINLNDVLASFDTFHGLDQEGYVIVDSNFNRIKVKHPGYVALHHLKGNDGPTPKKMLGIVTSGEGSEVLTHFPEWQPLYDDVKVRYDILVTDIEADFKRASQSVTSALPQGVVVTDTWKRKEFASHAVKTRLPDALFKMYAGKMTNLKAYLNEMDRTHLLKVLGMSDNGTP